MKSSATGGLPRQKRPSIGKSGLWLRRRCRSFVPERRPGSRNCGNWRSVRQTQGGPRSKRSEPGRRTGIDGHRPFGVSKLERGNAPIAPWTPSPATPLPWESTFSFSLPMQREADVRNAGPSTLCHSLFFPHFAQRPNRFGIDRLRRLPWRRRDRFRFDGRLVTSRGGSSASIRRDLPGFRVG